MSLLGSLANTATSLIDQTLLQGELVKMTLMVDPSDDRAAELKSKVLKFQFNPETISITRFSPAKAQPTIGTESKASDTNVGVQPDRESTINLGNIIFDTYERKPACSVYSEYIETLELFAGYDPQKHAPARLVLTWGKFTEPRKDSLALICKIDRLDVEYTMFLNDGLPVRAKVALSLKTGLPPEKQPEKKSPDHAKLVTVKRGDTLADIAYVEYANAAEWRRIADANGIDDPMVLTPGMKLLVPPILK